MAKIDCGIVHLDFKGEPIWLGCKVIVCGRRMPDKLHYGEVIKITPKMILVKVTKKETRTDGSIYDNSWKTQEYSIDIIVDDIEVERRKKLEMI